jgi:hypothetical protein
LETRGTFEIKNRCPGALGGGLGAILASRVAQDSKRETNFGSLTILGSSRGPLRGPIFAVFVDLFIFVCIVFVSLCFKGFRAPFLMDFGRLSLSFVELFFVIFGTSPTQEKLKSDHYLLCFKHIDLSENSNKSTRNQGIFEDTSGKGFGVRFFTHLDRFWELFGTLG